MTQQSQQQERLAAIARDLAYLRDNIENMGLADVWEWTDSLATASYLAALDAGCDDADIMYTSEDEDE